LIYDLHTHSNASDGFLTPTELVGRAKINGVTHLALTDHDTLGGLAQAQLQAEIEGIVLIRGIELSCLWAGRGVHIVGLNVDANCSALDDAISTLETSRDLRAQEIGGKLAKLGIEGAYQGALEQAQGAVIGRPHFARFLVAKGHASNINNAFKQYLGAGKVGDIKHRWPDIAAMVAAIKAAGGVAVLAHPLRYELTRTKLRELVAEFKAAGGLAVEVVSGQQSINDTQTVASIVELFGLYASCGSDFHLPGQPWQDLGRYSPMPQHLKPVWQLWH
jgi:3',5'-nucleoside bisphosphate phosphatase